MIKNIKQTKQKILEALEDLREFDVSWVEKVTYSKTLKAKDEKEAREMFNNCEIEGGNKDIVDCHFLEDSLEVEEVE